MKEKYQYFCKIIDKRYIFVYFTIHFDKNSQSEITLAIFQKVSFQGIKRLIFLLTIIQLQKSTLRKVEFYLVHFRHKPIVVVHTI